MEFNKMSTEELVELIRPKRCSDHYGTFTKDEKKAILHEIFVVRKAELSDEMLHGLLWSNLPPVPNGDEKLSALQHKLVGANPFVSSRSAMPAQLPANYVLTSFRALVASSIPDSVEVAKAAYYDLCLRGKEDEISDADMYSFVRKLIPSVGASNFKKIAVEMLQIIIENS